MPKFDMVPIQDAGAKTATGGKRAQILHEYLGYIDQLKSGEGGRLVAGDGERQRSFFLAFSCSGPIPTGDTAGSFRRWGVG